MRKVLTTIALMTIFIAAAGVTAKAIPTASDTVIGNFASMTASGISTVTSNTINVTVQEIHGLTTWNETGANDGTITPGGTKDYVVSVVNNANTSDSVGVKVGAFGFNGSPGTLLNWSVAADDAQPFVAALTWDNSADIKAYPLGDQASTTVLIAQGAQATFTVRVTAAADAQDAATMAFTLRVQMDSQFNTPVGSYSGYNAVNYGGPELFNRTVGSQGAATVTTTVIGAVLTLAKAAVVTAPAGYTGAGTDPVPGARITYTLTYGNTGTGDAYNVIITDLLPANTTLEDGSINLTGFVTGIQTEEDDADECDYNVTTANTITCEITKIITPFTGGSVGNTIEYSVTIN